MGPHTLRHTFATLRLQAGDNPVIVSKELGHHDVGFTLRTYAHVLPGMGAVGAAKLDAIIFRQSSAKNVVPITKNAESLVA